MTNDIYTENLADFGSRERRMLAEILALPLPEQFSDDGVKAAFKRNSGFVFLVNADYQCAMLNEDSGKLEIFHSTPYSGLEGFITDLLAENAPDDLHADDAEYIRDNAEIEGVDLPGNWKEVA
jgi:hypothetical protein